ncbi:hypothetical protein COBT_002279 [Conglomerata obtusa]
MQSSTNTDTGIGTNGKNMLMRVPNYSSNPDDTDGENECVRYCFFNQKDFSEPQIFKKLINAINIYCRIHILNTLKTFDKNAYYEYINSLIHTLHTEGYLTPYLKTSTTKLKELEEVKGIEKLLKLKPRAW